MRICKNCQAPYIGRGRVFCSRDCWAQANEDWPSRFWAKVQKTDGCWEWQAARDEHGYGIFAIQAVQYRAHRIAYQLTHGSLPDDLVVRHTCDNPPCVNPEHLIGGTQLDNITDRNERGRTAKGDQAGFRRHPERYPSRKGEHNGRAKITQSLADEIRERYRAGDIGARTLAKQYGVSRALIRFIVKGEIWT
jgi:hypothetical protein